MFQNLTTKVTEAKILFELLNSYLMHDGEIFEYFFSKEKLDSLNIDS